MAVKKRINIYWNIGLWTGMFVIALINIELVLLNRSPIAFDLYISGIAFVILVISSIILFKRKK